MNGKCAKRIRIAYRAAFCSGSDVTYKKLKAQYKAFPYHKRWNALVIILGACPKSWQGQVPGHSQRLKERLYAQPLHQNRRAARIQKALRRPI